MKTVAPLLSPSTHSSLVSEPSKKFLGTEKISRTSETSFTGQINNIAETRKEEVIIKDSELIQFGNRFRVLKGKNKEETHI